MSDSEEYDSVNQTAPDCGMCGAEEDGIRGVPIQVEGGGVVDVDLCDECLNKVERYNRGEDVEFASDDDTSPECAYCHLPVKENEAVPGPHGHAAHESCSEEANDE